MSDNKHSKEKDKTVHDDAPLEEMNQETGAVAEPENEDHPSDHEHKAKDKKSKKDKSSEKMEELGLRLVELSDRHLRLQAEFDNFRKRTLKEKADLIKSGGETVLTNILPILDDFDRALSTMTEVPDEDPSKVGFLLIFSKFKDFLKSNSVMEIDAIGQDFDVDMHDAITKIPAPSEEMKGKVVDVLQKGYMLNGRVIRYAKVIIGD
jgi:molecular chaperone GrpE